MEIMKKKKWRFTTSFLVVLPGFEPRQADPESDVLPLHHRTLPCFQVLFPFKSGCKSTHFFLYGKTFFYLGIGNWELGVDYQYFLQEKNLISDFRFPGFTGCRQIRKSRLWRLSQVQVYRSAG